MFISAEVHKASPYHDMLNGFARIQLLALNLPMYTEELLNNGKAIPKVRILQIIIGG